MVDLKDMELKKIQSRYACKCSRCGRQINSGWTVYFEPKTKNVYCRPCGEIGLQKIKQAQTGIEELPPQELKETDRDVIERLDTNVQEFYVMLSSYGKKLEEIVTLLDKLDTDLRDLPRDIAGLVKSSPAKSTKKSK